MCVAVCFGQLKHDANWCFGEGAGMHFNEDSTVDIFHCETSNLEANASFSSVEGDLLFYAALNNFSRLTKDILTSNGIPVGNGIEINMVNTITSGGVFIPNSFDSVINFYYLGQNFDTLTNTNRYDLMVAIISKIGNSYEVSSKNKVIVTGHLQEKIAATKAVESDCWWILTHLREVSCDNTFITLKVCNGLVIDSFHQNVGTLLCNGSNFYGELTFSDDGTILVNPLGELGIVEVYNFDRCNGNITLANQISGFSGLPYIYGIEIYDKYIYISEFGNASDSSFIYQYNLSNSSLNLIHAFDSLKNAVTQLERGPNDKIYISHTGLSSNFGLANNSTQCLSIIHNPGQPGMACNFEPFGFCFPDSIKMNSGLPNFPNYNLSPEGVFLATAGKDTTLCSKTNNTGVTIGAPPVPNIIYTWQPATGLSATNIAQPVANPSQSTWYYLTATDTTATTCAVNTDSVFVKVETCTGITETPTQQAKLYPNPTNGLLTVEVPQGTGGYTFRLFNLLGQQVLEYPLEHDKTTFPLDFAKGIYLYQITAHTGQVQNGKLVVE
jgi:hypothetical protein